MLWGAQESSEGYSLGVPCLASLSPINIPGSSEGHAGQEPLTKLLSVSSWREEAMCVFTGRTEGGGTQAGRPHSHPPPKPALQRKSHLRPRWGAQQVHRSPARLAPGPGHMEQGGVSRMAWPRLPLTPPEYTHRGPRVSPTLLWTHTSPVCPKSAPGSGSLTQPW